MVNFRGIAHYPTLVEVYLTFGGVGAGWPGDLLSTFAQAIPPALLPTPVLGGVDVLDALPEVVYSARRLAIHYDGRKTQ